MLVLSSVGSTEIIAKERFTTIDARRPMGKSLRTVCQRKASQSGADERQ